MPWAYVRDLLARRYSQAPHQIDEWSYGEINEAVKIMNLEATCHPPERR